jgi:hypothetical protein
MSGMFWSDETSLAASRFRHVQHGMLSYIQHDDKATVHFRQNQTACSCEFANKLGYWLWLHMHCSAEMDRFTAPRCLQTSTQHKQKKSKQEQSSVPKTKKESCVKTSLSKLLKMKGYFLLLNQKRNFWLHAQAEEYSYALLCDKRQQCSSNDHGLAVKEYACTVGASILLQLA